MARPEVNAIGHLLNNITDPLIAAPVERAVRAGASDLLAAIGRLQNEIANGSAMISAGNAVGGIYGGLASGIIGGTAGLLGAGLAEVFRNAREQKRHDEILDKFTKALRQR